MKSALRRTVLLVAILNLAYFGVEFTIAQVIKSVSLFADSIDFLEDAATDFLVLLALGWSLAARQRVAFVLALMLLVPSGFALWAAYEKVVSPVPPHGLTLSLAGFGALVVNSTCAYLLARVQQHGGSLMRAAYLSARNDALANVAIVVAGGITMVWASAWPDIVVGLGIFLLNLDAVHEVYEAARSEGAD